MTIKQLFRRNWVVVVMLLGAALLGGWGVQALTQLTSTSALGSGFSYQGRLADSNGDPITDTCTLTFGLYDAAAGGAQVGADHVIGGVNVENGLFTVTLNDADQFGATAFNGQPRWLQIAVQCTGDVSPTVLGLQPINPVPYALFAERFGGYQNIIVVAQSNGDFDSVAEAVAAIGVDPRYPAATANNRYLVYIAPGVYDDARVILKSYVDLEGAGQGLTMLNYPAGTGSLSEDSAVVEGAAHSEIRHLTVNNTNTDTTSWAIGVYNDKPNFRLLHVTVTSIGGQRSRAVVAADGGGSLTADYVTVSATGGVLNSVGVTVNDAEFYASHLKVYAEDGSNNTVGISLNNAGVVRISTVEITVVSEGLLDYGISGNLLSDAVIDGMTLQITNEVDAAYGVYMLNSPGVSFENAMVTIDNVALNVTGLYYQNSGLALDNANVSIYSAGPANGIYSDGGVSGTFTVGLSNIVLEIDYTTASANGNGLWLNTTHGSANLRGDVRDVVINMTSSAANNNNLAVLQTSFGAVTYQNMNIDLQVFGTTNASGFGMWITRGLAIVLDTNIEVYNFGGPNSVYGLITDTAGILNAERVRIVVQNGGTFNAEGVRIDTDFNRHRLRQVSVEVFGPSDVYGFNLRRGTIFATQLSAIVEDTTPNGWTFGLNCGVGSGGSTIVSLNLDGASLEAIGPEHTDALQNSSVVGLNVNECNLNLSNANILARGQALSHTGLIAIGDSQVNISQATIKALGSDSAFHAAMNTGVYYGSPLGGNSIDNSLIAANQSSATGSQFGLHLVDSGAGQPLVVRNSTFISINAVVYEDGDNLAEIYSSVLDGLAVIAVPASSLECTGVSRIVGGVASFIAGPANCP